MLACTPGGFVSIPGGLIMTVISAKMAEAIEVLFREQTRVGLRNRVFDGCI